VLGFGGPSAFVNLALNRLRNDLTTARFAGAVRRRNQRNSKQGDGRPPFLNSWRLSEGVVLARSLQTRPFDDRRGLRGANTDAARLSRPKDFDQLVVHNLTD